MGWVYCSYHSSGGPVAQVDRASDFPNPVVAGSSPAGPTTAGGSASRSTYFSHISARANFCFPQTSACESISDPAVTLLDRFYFRAKFLLCSLRASSRRKRRCGSNAVPRLDFRCGNFPELDSFSLLRALCVEVFPYYYRKHLRGRLRRLHFASLNTNLSCVKRTNCLLPRWTAAFGALTA